VVDAVREQQASVPNSRARLLNPMGVTTLKIILRHSRASLLVAALSLIGIFAPYIVVRAYGIDYTIPADQTLLNSTGTSPNIYAHQMGRPVFGGTYQDQIAWGISPTGYFNAVVCGVEVTVSNGSGSYALNAELWRGDIPGGTTKLQDFIANTSTGIYTQADAVPYDGWVTSSTFEYVLDPCVILWWQENYWFRLKMPDDISGNPYYYLAVPANPYVGGGVTSTYSYVYHRDDDTLPNVYSQTGGSAAYWAGSTFPENIALIGRWFGAASSSSFTSPNVADYGLSGTSTNPGDFGLFGNWFIAAMQWLFVPSSDTWRQFNESSQTRLATKIPFGWFAQVSSTFAGLQDEDTTTTVFTVYASSTTSTLSAVFFDSQAIKAAIPENIRTLVRLLGGLALWTAFFFWLWSLATGRHTEVDI